MDENEPAILPLASGLIQALGSLRERRVSWSKIYRLIKQDIVRMAWGSLIASTQLKN